MGVGLLHIHFSSGIVCCLVHFLDDVHPNTFGGKAIALLVEVAGMCVEEPAYSLLSFSCCLQRGGTFPKFALIID